MYEEFRMLSFINNIKIQTPNDSALRPLSAEERELIMPLFFRKSKKQFDFEDIAKKLAPKKHYGFYKKVLMQKCHIFSITLWIHLFLVVL